jgi:hypothetical protein
MCFSAGASFGAGIVLATVGIASLKKVQTPSQKPFASIPILFAIQQFSEGFLWLSLSNPAHASWQQIPVYVFLAFAQIVWPTWVPFSILMVEKDAKRKRILMLMLGIGMMVSSYLAYCMVVYHLEAQIAAYHIQYTLHFPMAVAWFSGMVYFIPTVLPPFVSGIKRMRILGLTILTSYLITTVFFHEYIISIWCFFAAVLSVMILSIMSVLNKKDTEVHQSVIMKVSPH